MRNENAHSNNAVMSWREIESIFAFAYQLSDRDPDSGSLRPFERQSKKGLMRVSDCGEPLP
jgi:hypothetical protein